MKEAWELAILNRIVATLEKSDIVWPKYGTQTIHELAQKLLEEFFDGLKDSYPEVPRL